MNNFQNLLNDYIEIAGIANNKLIRETGIDRSTFYKVLNGQRQATEEQLENIIRALRLPRKDEDALRREYFRQTIGEEEWQNRQIIRRLLQVLAEPELDTLTSAEIAPGSEPDYRKHTAKGLDPVNQMLLQFIQDELVKDDPKIDFFFPVEHEELYRSLRGLCSLHVGKEIRIRQLMQFPTGQMLSKCSILEYFEHLVYFLTGGEWDYQAYYYYERALLQTGIGNLFPYYIIAEKKVLILNADFTMSYLIMDPETVSLYKEMFNKVVNESKPIRESIDYLEMLAILEMPGRKVSFESIPCAAMVAKSDYIRKYMADGEFSDFIWNHCRRLQEENELMIFSTMGGLERFARTGIVEEVPPGLMAAMSVEDRIESFRNLKPHIQKEYFIVDESVMPVSDTWMLTLFEENALFIYPRIATGDERVICVKEKSIIQAFTSFFRSFSKGTDLVDSETVQSRIDDLINGLEEGDM